MSKIWACREDVDTAVNTIAMIHRSTGTLPPELLQAYKEILEGTSKGLVARFYEMLAIKRPEVMPLFTSRISPGGM